MYRTEGLGMRLVPFSFFHGNIVAEEEGHDGTVVVAISALCDDIPRARVMVVSCLALCMPPDEKRSGE